MLSSTKCRLAGNGGSTGSGAAVDGVAKQAGGRQLLRGGMGGAAGGTSSCPAAGSDSGGVVDTGGERKTWRFMGTGRSVGRGAGAGGAWARSRPAKMRRRCPGSSRPMSTRWASLRPWHSVVHTSPCCSKSPVYCSRCSARSHSATDKAASPPSAMVSASRGPARRAQSRPGIDEHRSETWWPRSSAPHQHPSVFLPGQCHSFFFF